LVLSTDLEFVGKDESRLLAAGEEVSWPRAFVHGYRNTGKETASILCIDSPPFMPDDEQVVQL